MDELRTQVQRLIDAGVPEKEIGAFIQTHSEPSQPEAQPQAKIGALNPNPVFSDKPDFMGEAVGSPSLSFGKEALGVANVIDRPRQAILGSSPAYTAENPFQDLEQRSLSPYDIAGGLSRSLLQQGASSEALPQDIVNNQRKPFGDIAETVGKAGLDLSTMGPYYGGLGKLAGGLTDLKLVGNIDKIDKEISLGVEKGISKGIRDTQRGKLGWMDQQRYMDRAKVAVEDIVENKSILKLKDKNGYEITGKLPQNLKQMSQAINQRLESVWKEGEALIKQATGKGADINLESIGSKLESMATEGLRLGDKTAYNHAIKLAEEFKNTGSTSASDAVETLKRINARIKGQIQSGKKGFTMSGRGFVDYEANVLIREQLDSIIENLTGKRYQPIRDKYAAYKTIEKDTINRLIVDARKNQYGVMDIADVFTGYHAVRGVLTWDIPTMTASFSSQALATIRKLGNDPNRIVRKMFSDVDKLVNKKSALTPKFPPTPLETKMPPPIPKQIPWQGVIRESGNPILMKQGEQFYQGQQFNPPRIAWDGVVRTTGRNVEEPYSPQLLRAKAGGAKSKVPNKPKTTIQPEQRINVGEIKKEEPTIYKAPKKTSKVPMPLLKTSDVQSSVRNFDTAVPVNLKALLKKLNKENITWHQATQHHGTHFGGAQKAKKLLN